MHLLLAGFFPDIFWGWVMFPKSWWSGKDVWSGDMWMLRLSWSITTIVSLRLSLQYMQIADAERNTSSEKWKWVFSSYIVWIDRISSTSYKTACLFRPDSCLLSALHLPLPLFFFSSHIIPSAQLSLGSHDAGDLSMTTQACCLMGSQTCWLGFMAHFRAAPA